MNTTAIELPARRTLFWADRARALFNGIGYATAFALVLACWWALLGVFPELLAGQPRAAAHDYFFYLWLNIIAEIPGPILTPLAINLAPRRGWLRAPCLLAAAIPMLLWCLAFERISTVPNLHLAGTFVEGILTTSLVVWVCAYHSHWRDAGDALARSRISRAGLDMELRRSQLQLLRAQIEPHFLFNTLSAVRVLARTDRNATVEMLDNLIRYFEAALPRLRQDEVPLAREMQLVDAYLSIYRMRMGRRLSYEIDLPQELAAVPVPTMLLLTLVENALKHGVNPAVEGGRIRVSARDDSDRLLLTVADSGRGLNVRLGHGAGLANIRQRLLLLHGERAVLSLRPAEPRGVVASVAIPLSPAVGA